MTFRRSSTGWLHSWEPDPDDAAAHTSLLVWLTNIVPAFLPAPVAISNWLKGNVGESIAHCIGSDVVEPGTRVFCANALDPFCGISKTEIDLVWLILGESPPLDVAILQEVKTTSDPNLSVVGGLVDDYDKLFATEMARTLSSRLHAIANEIEYTGADATTANRVRGLAAARSPELATQLRLRPTVVHSDGLDPSSRVETVRNRLLGLGWNGAAVEGWTILLGDLDDRIVQLAEGR